MVAVVKLSVIVPMLRRDDAAERCLAEIRRQAAEGGAELDLVVVEGVSPVGKARNIGLSRAKGDYVAWVDADDIVLEGWWSAIVNALEDSPDVVILGWKDDDRGGEVSLRVDMSSSEVLFRSVLRDESPYSYLWNKVFKRILFLDETFDETLRFQDDFELMPKVLRKAKSIRLVDGSLYHYRHCQESVSRNESIARYDELFDVRYLRFEAWKDSCFGRDAIVPFAEQIAFLFEKTALPGASDEAKGVLRRQKRRLRGLGLFVLCSKLEFRFKAKVLMAILGLAWPLKAYWLIWGRKAHG